MSKSRWVVYILPYNQQQPSTPKTQHLSPIGRVHCRGVGNATGGRSFIEAVTLTAVACKISAGFSGHLRSWKSTILNGRYPPVN